MDQKRTRPRSISGDAKRQWGRDTGAEVPAGADSWETDLSYTCVVVILSHEERPRYADERTPS